MHHPLTPVATVPVDPRPAGVHEDGRPSRSPSGARALDTRPHRPTNADRAAVRHRPGVAVPAGAFPGEGPAAPDPGDGSPVRLRAATDPPREVPSIRPTARGGHATASGDRLPSLDGRGVRTTRRLPEGGR